MEIKIDTKEKFKVITPLTAIIDDKIANELKEQCINIFEKEKISIIVKFSLVNEITTMALEIIHEIHNIFSENKLSFVVCEFNNEVLKQLKINDLIENFNYAPTESEAWDIVQLEEIERELFSDEE